MPDAPDLTEYPAVLVVIPSNRQVRLDYLGPLIDDGARFIVIDDSEGTIRIDHPQFEVFNWQDRRRLLGSLEHAIPRRNGASRSLGFYLAWRDASPGEIVVALDDDCLIEESAFAATVRERLDGASAVGAVGRGRFFNVFDVYRDLDTTTIFPRGFPYSARVGYEPWSPGGPSPGPVHFNLGLWQGVFDVNAVDKIHLERYAFPEAALRAPAVVVPPGTLASACSMNMHFRAEVVPAIYQLPMHVEVIPNGVIDRYGDIWGGYILKTVMDVRGDRFTVGGPMIRHLKEGDYVRNIWQEQLCHLVNDEFIALLGRVRAVLKPASYLDMMAHVHQELARAAEGCSPILRAYLKHLDGTLGAWIALLRQRG